MGQKFFEMRLGKIKIIFLYLNIDSKKNAFQKQ